MSGKKKQITVSLDSGIAAGLARWRATAGDVDPEALAYARRALIGEQVERQPQVS